MTNAKQITTIAIIIAITSSIATYAFTSQNDQFTLIEAENKKAKIEKKQKNKCCTLWLTLIIRLCNIGW